jgi:DNA-binding response OmpR family regulator
LLIPKPDEMLASHKARKDPEQAQVEDISAKSDVLDKVLLLEIGAYDYVTKPFSPRELLARVRAALRRSTRVNVGDAFVFDDVSVSFSKMEVTRGGQPVSLTAQEFKTLKFMLQNAERVISREELLSEVWGYQNYPLYSDRGQPYPETAAQAGERPCVSCAFQNRPRRGLQIRTLRSDPKCEPRFSG